MTKEWIEQKIEEAHENVVDKGFYECPECGGACCDGNNHGCCDGHCEKCQHSCPTCQETGIDPNKNIGELLMLIVSELGEAIEAHRKGRFTKKQNLSNYFEYDSIRNSESEIPLEKARSVYFERWIKDSFEDEIADVFIRLFDLCGYLDIKDVHIQQWKNFKDYSGNIGEALLYASGMICEMHIEKEKGSTDRDYICDTLSLLNLFCKKWNIPIEKHIESKMEYNKTRPYKHGKAY